VRGAEMINKLKNIKKWLQENIDADLYEYYGIKKGGIENGK
jgi:hypothetical protein